MTPLEIKRNKAKNELIKIQKQGPCGSFCFKYWIGSGCDEDCPNGKNLSKIKID